MHSATEPEAGSREQRSDTAWKEDQMKSLKRQFYFAAMIGLILFGIAKSNDVRGTDLLTETVNYTETINQ